MLNLHVLGTIMVDAGSRAASVTIHRVMDIEHGLGNVTGEIMLNTLLNHWIKCYGEPNIVRTDPEGAFRDQGFRRGLSVLALILGTRSGKQECLENTGMHQTSSSACGTKNNSRILPRVHHCSQRLASKSRIQQSSISV